MENCKPIVKMLFLALAPLLAVTAACGINPMRSEMEKTADISESHGKQTQQNRADDLVFARQGWIYFLAASEKQPLKLVRGNFPTLHGNKRQVVYVKPQSPDSDPEAVLMLYDLKTKKDRELYRVNGFINYPRFAPEGDLVLFILRTPEGKTKLEVFNTEGEETFTVDETNKEINNVFSPVWAPDGNSIYFHDMTNLFHINFEGQIMKKIPLRRITGSQESITSSDWYIPSPKDENILVFTQLVPGTPLFDKTFGEPNTALFTYDLDADEKKRLTAENVFAVDPMWSVNGDLLYFTGYFDKNGRENYPFRIFRIKQDGSDLSEITRGENADN